MPKFTVHFDGFGPLEAEACSAEDAAWEVADSMEWDGPPPDWSLVAVDDHDRRERCLVRVSTDYEPIFFVSSPGKEPENDWERRFVSELPKIEERNDE